MKFFLIIIALSILISSISLAQTTDTHLTRGQEYSARGDSLRAEGQYMLAIESDPQSAEAHARLGEIYAKRKNYKKAVQSFENALSLGYKDPLFFTRFAFSLKMSGDLDGAVRVYQVFVANHPDLPGAHLGLGGLYDEIGMKDKGEEEYGLYRELRNIK